MLCVSLAYVIGPVVFIRNFLCQGLYNVNEVGLYSILRHADKPVLLMLPVFLRAVEIWAVSTFFYDFSCATSRRTRR